ncbi:ABC transporter permease [Facklamia miroungae]|uniref:ABC-2 type transport system permease protein n=1 Tax=Facklamia miroungae TaxID=120956 RepID=A0A1G7RU25_9LACT|nr:ABC-2 family transporter protein [Facklamia miroungae]SDG14242.1 ABC-2 type transport system permease protein [Facklamia miroungae]
MFKILRHYFKLNWQAQWQYPVSMLLLIMGQFLATFVSVLGIYFMLERFHSVQGFSKDEVLLCAGIFTFAAALAEMLARGFDSFPQMIANGEFDRVLTRPQSPLLQVIGSKFEFSRIGRLIQAALLLVFVIERGKMVWSWNKIATLFIMILTASLLFSLLYFLSASLSFFTIQGLEIMNIFTDGGREFGQYPFSIYGKKILKFLTFILPLALVQYYPFLYLVGKSNDWRLALFTFLSLVFAIPVYGVWRFGLYHYQSTGS